MLSVFGSINLDVSVRAPRLPGPGETLLGGASLVSPGGKGANQAHAAQRFGVPTRLFGAVGDDAFAGPALAMLRASGVDLGGVVVTPGQATGLAAITVADSGENAIVVAPGANAHARAAQVSDGALRDARVLLLQLETPPGETLALAGRARALGCRVVLNASPLLPDVRLDGAAVDTLIVNDVELGQLCQLRRIEGAAALDKAQALARALGCDVLVTLGAEGSCFAGRDGRSATVPAMKVTPVDTTGAGDTYAGVFAAALAQGESVERGMALASVAAGLACLAPGAQAAQPDRAAIDARLAEPT